MRYSVSVALNLRPPTPADTEPCGRIIYEAFRGIATQHNFPIDFPSVEIATQLARDLIARPDVFGVVAEQDGRIAGSNFLTTADPIQGVGPITVDTAAQGGGIGRRLMQAVIERGRGAAGIRLVQDAFNTRSMSLYASLGFEVKEPLVIVQGNPESAPPAGRTVRPMEPGDVDECADLCRRVHGFDRASELRHIHPPADPWVGMRQGRIVAYATALNFWVAGHGVAESEEDMVSLALGFAAARAVPLWFLLPTRQASFFRWCLREGLRVIKPMTLMTMGEYREPMGCWIPAVWY